MLCNVSSQNVSCMEEFKFKMGLKNCEANHHIEPSNLSV